MMNQHLPRIEIVRHPNVDFGVSIESPSNFQMQHSLISNRSYVNPFVQLNQSSLSKLKTSQSQAAFKVPPQWTKRQHLSNLSTIQNQNGYLTGRKVQSQVVAPGLNHKLQLDKPFDQLYSEDNSKYFHKRKGEFTSYMQNHIQNLDFVGPILGDQRSQQKRNTTKEKIRLQKLQKLQQTKAKFVTIKPNRALSPLIQKSKIHKDRLEMSDSVHEKYEEKQKVKTKTKQFELPKINKYQLEGTLVQIKSNYKRFKNQNLTKSFLTSSLSSIKTADLDRSGLLNKSKFV